MLRFIGRGLLWLERFAKFSQSLDQVIFVNVRDAWSFEPPRQAQGYTQLRERLGWGNNGLRSTDDKDQDGVGVVRVSGRPDAREHLSSYSSARFMTAILSRLTNQKKPLDIALNSIFQSRLGHSSGRKKWR